MGKRIQSRANEKIKSFSKKKNVRKIRKLPATGNIKEKILKNPKQEIL
jgi:hypothetical protein